MVRKQPCFFGTGRNFRGSELRLRSTRDLSVSGSINALMVVKRQEHGIYCMRNNGFRVVFCSGTI